MNAIIQFLSILALVIGSQRVSGHRNNPSFEAAHGSSWDSRRPLALRSSGTHSENRGRTFRTSTTIERSSTIASATASYGAGQLQQSGGSNPGLVFDVIHRQHPNSPLRAGSADQKSSGGSSLMRESLRRAVMREESLNRIIEEERTAAVAGGVKSRTRARANHHSSVPSLQDQVLETKAEGPGSSSSFSSSRGNSPRRRLTKQESSKGNIKDQVSEPRVKEKAAIVLPGSSSSLPGENWQGEYLVQMEIGTPPKPILLIVDTGSGLTWIQCSNCVKCFNQQDPIFDPSASSSYRMVNCPSPACSSSSSFQCAGPSNGTCEYGVQYSSQSSFTTGVVSKDTLKISALNSSHGDGDWDGAAVILEEFLFGCGMYNMGDDFVGNSGLLGLSRTNISFPKQLADGLNFSKKFTYCFADLSEDPNATSFISFGDQLQPQRRLQQQEYIPFAETPFPTQFYYIPLSGISVDGHRLPINISAFVVGQDGNGGTVIDSGTSLTLLLPQAYNLLRDAFRSAAAEKRYLPGLSPEGFNSSNSSGHVIDTCYQFNSGRKPPASAVPSITLHFSDSTYSAAAGFDLTLPSKNVLFPFNNEGLYCLAFTSTLIDAGVNVLGNIQQQDFRIEYDLDNSRIGFRSASCADERVG